LIKLQESIWSKAFFDIYLRNTLFGETTEATNEAIFDADLELLSDVEIAVRRRISNPDDTDAEIDSYVQSVNDPFNSARIITDLSVGYSVSNDLRLTVGANNLLDIYPDLVDDAFRSSGRFIYSRRAPQFSYGGRYLFARLAFTLK